MKMYVLQIAPGCEESAAKLIADKGFTASCPSEEMHIRYSGVWHKKLKLIFTQYIFVECELTDDNYYKIKSVPGVVRFLGYGKPEPLKEDEQAYITLLRNSGKPIEASKVYTTSEGDIMAMSGLLRSCTGRVISMDLRQRRAKLRIYLHGKPHTITIPVISL